MKKIALRLIGAVLLIATVLACFSGCSGISRKAAIRYGDQEISRGLFQYLCCMEKTSYLYELYGVDSESVQASQLEDNPAFWTAVASDGMSAGDTLKMEVLEQLQVNLFLANYAVEQGYTLGVEQKKAIQAEFDKMVKQFQSKALFEKQMKQYGVDYDELLKYNYFQNLAWKGNDLLFGEEGTMKISEDSIQKYFNKNYITVGSIFINTKNKTYPNGKVVVLPAAEKEAKIQLAQEVFNRAKAGEDFAALSLEYSDSKTMSEKISKSGYTFEKGGFENSEAEAKAFEMAEGDVIRVEVSGGYYILKRMPLNSGYFSDVKDVISEKLTNTKKFSLLLDYMDQFKMDEDFLNQLDISVLPHVV